MGTTLEAGPMPAAKPVTNINQNPLGLHQSRPPKAVSSTQPPDSKGTTSDAQTGASQQDQTPSFHAALNKELHKKSPETGKGQKKDSAKKSNDKTNDSAAHPIIAAVYLENTEESHPKPTSSSASMSSTAPKSEHVTLASTAETMTGKSPIPTLNVASLKAVSGKKLSSSLSPASQTKTESTSRTAPKAVPSSPSDTTSSPTASAVANKIMASASLKEAVVQVPTPNPETPTQGRDPTKPEVQEAPATSAPLTPTDRGSKIASSSFIQALVAKMESTQQPSGAVKPAGNPSSNHPAGTAPLPADQVVEISDRKGTQQTQQTQDNPNSRLNATVAANVQTNVTSKKSAGLPTPPSGSGSKNLTEISMSPNHVATAQHTASAPSQSANTAQVMAPGTAGPLNPSTHPARDLAQQILNSIHSTIQGQQKTVTIDLSPPELGRVTIRFQETHDGIQGELQVNRAETRYDVERALPQIMHNLQTHGIQIRKMEVNVNVNNHQHAETPHHDQDARQQQPGGSQQQTSDQRWAQQQNRPGQSPATLSQSTSSARPPQGSLNSDDPASYARLDQDSIDMLM